MLNCEPGTSSHVHVVHFTEPTNHQRKCTIRVTYTVSCLPRFLIFVVMMAQVSCYAKCYNTDKGMSIEGGDYRRIRNVKLKACAIECREDFSCLAYEWNEAEYTCILKSRSTSGPLVTKKGVIIGFCIDDDDEVRDRFRDHVVLGPVAVTQENIIGAKCRSFCESRSDIVIYSWTPSEAVVVQDEEQDSDDDEYDEMDNVKGTCKCISTLQELRLQFDSFSGFLPPRREKRSRLHSNKEFTLFY